VAVNVSDYYYDMSPPAIEAKLDDGWSSRPLGSRDQRHDRAQRPSITGTR
jgi:hypothetical protein